MPELTGSCLCGAVTYRVAADPLFTAICHCTDCQKQTGTSFSLAVGVPRAAFAMEGESLACFHTTTEDDGTDNERWFCSRCGSPIVTLKSTMPELAIVKAGTLDDAAGLEPQLEVYCGSAQPWVPQDMTAQRMPRGVPATAA